MDKRIINKQKIVIILLVVIVIFLLGYVINLRNKTNNLVETIANKNVEISSMQSVIDSFATTVESGEKDLGWELVLVNYNNKIPDDYEFTLENIDSSRKFDSRAISYLKEMLSDAKEDGITNLWAQSTYRTVELQEDLFDEKVQEYESKGYSETVSKILTENSINKPGYSEHNIGLCVDFNNVDNAFEKTKAFKWLKENAEDYGFVLRYAEEKEEITRVKYEPWHWRYVGQEHAKEMNELNMCLEEYVDYLRNK